MIAAVQSSRAFDVSGIGASAIQEAFAPISLATEPDPAWLYVTQFEPAALQRVSAVPGVRRERDRVRVPLNLVLARPEWFNIVFDPGQLAVAPAATAAALASVPEAIANPLTGEVTTLPYHQRVGVAHLRQPGGAILGTALGGGKSLSALVAASLSAFNRVLVVGPINSRRTWCADVGDPWRRLAIRVTPLEGIKDPGRDAPRAGWVFLHYDIVDAWFSWFANVFQPDLIILDEAHRLYGHKTKRAERMMSLCRLKTVQARYLLTGTQVRNDRANLFPLLSCAQPLAWGSTFWEFAPRYVGVAQGEYGLLVGRKAREAAVDSVHTYDDEFDARLRHVLLRFEREEFGDSALSAPGMDLQVIEAEIADVDRQRYQEAARNIIAHLRAKGIEVAAGAGSAALREVGELCSLLSSMKVPATVEEIEEDLDRAGHVLVYTWYRSSAEGIAAVLRAHNRRLSILGPITGATTVKRREKLVSEFRLHKPPVVLIATLGTLAEASNDLVAAHIGIMHDLYWDPTPLLQGMGRLDRPGQISRVLWKFVRAADTIEDRMVERLQTAAAEIRVGRGGRAAGDLAAALSGPVAPQQTAEEALHGLFADLLALEAA